MAGELYTRRFIWLAPALGQVLAAATLELTAQQFEALAIGLPWQRLSELSVINADPIAGDLATEEPFRAVPRCVERHDHLVVGLRHPA